MTYTVDEQEEFLQALSKLWHKYPDMTFGHLVMQVYTALNGSFSQLAFTRFQTEGWMQSVEGILETMNDPAGT